MNDWVNALVFVVSWVAATVVLALAIIGTLTLCSRTCRGLGYRDKPAIPNYTDNIHRLMSLLPGWDGGDAPLISSRAMNAALDVLETRGQMTPCSDGGVQIDWPNAEIRFAPDGSQDCDSKAREAEHARFVRDVRAMVDVIESLIIKGVYLATHELLVEPLARVKAALTESSPQKP